MPLTLPRGLTPADIGQPDPLTPQPAPPTPEEEMAAQNARNLAAGTPPTATPPPAPATPAPPPAPPPVQAPTPAPALQEPAPQPKYSTAVESLRSTAAKYFPPDVIDKVLYVIEGESGGNPTISGDGGAAYGLFQSHYVPRGATIDQQFQDAARLYNADKANGGTGFGDWGEGRLYNGQPFGALGRNPYSAAATGTTATAVANRPTNLQGATAPAVPLATGTTAEAIPHAITNAEYEAQARAAVAEHQNPQEKQHLEAVLGAAETQGKTGRELFDTVQQALKDIGGTPHAASLGGTGNLDLTKPLDVFRATGAPFDIAGEALATVLDPAINKIPGPARTPARRFAYLLPGFLIGPGKIVTKVGMALASAAGGQVTQALKLPGGTLSGEVVAPFVAPFAISKTAAGLRNLLGPEDAAREAAAKAAPGFQEGHIPGQQGLFGETVNAEGQIVPTPETGAAATPAETGFTPKEQATSFPQGAEGAQTGLFGGEAGVQQGFGSVPETAPAPTTPKGPPMRAPEPLPEANGLQRDRRIVKVSDLEYRPDIFQHRDADPGKAFKQTTVDRYVRNWNDALFTPPSVVPDPMNPGKWIVYAGHHRTEAYATVKGLDANIEVIATHADLTDPMQLAALKGEADATNFATATPNIREKIRVVQRGMADGKTDAEIADILNSTTTTVDTLRDISRLGEQAVDRVTSTPQLEPYATEIGRAMRVHGITVEDANGLFNQIADSAKTQWPTPGSLRETLDQFGAMLAQKALEKNQGALFDIATANNEGGGLLTLMKENAKLRTQLTKEINAVRRAMKGTQRLAAAAGAENSAAVKKLLANGQARVDALRAQLDRNEENLLRVARGEAPLPDLAPETPVSAASAEPAPTEATPPTEPTGNAAPPRRGRGTTPPAEPPTGTPPVGGDDLENLVAAVEAAGAARPNLLAARSEELGRRVAAMEEYRAKLLAEGRTPSEASQLATSKLRGQLADPSFELPAALNADALGEAINASDLLPLQRLNAQIGLDKLVTGQIPAPHEVELLGQVFGPRLKQAIEDLGDIFKVQRRVEERLIANPIEITWPDGAPVTPESLAEAMQRSMPQENPDVIAKVADRLVARGEIKQTVSRNGKPAVTFSKDETDALGKAAREFMFAEEVPHQEVPPTQPGEFQYQPSLAEGEGQIGRGPADYTITPAPEPTPTLAQQRLTRAAAENPANITPEATTAQAPAPKYIEQPIPGGRTATIPQYRLPGKAWQPGQDLLGKIAREVWNLPSLPKALLATLDRSAYLRQGLMLVRRGRQTSEAIGKTLFIAEDAEQAARWKEVLGFTPPNAQEVMDTLKYGKWAQVRKNAGLVVEDWGPGAKAANENFTSELARHIPVLGGAVQMSERSYVVYLNKLRADVFDSIAEKWAHDSRIVNEDTFKALADYLNAATGHGSLGKFEEAASILSKSFFSPRNVVSRFQVIEMLFDPRTPYLVRKEMAKDLVVFVGAGVALLSVAKASGLADVEIDPRSPDFGKMRIGNTRIDLWTGYAQIARLVAMLGTGQAKATTGTVYGIKPQDAIARYIRSKLAPTPGQGVNLLFDDQFTGNKHPFVSWQTVYDNFTPLFIQDVYDAVQQEGVKGLAYAPVAFFGGSVQTYVSPSEERNKGRDQAVRQMFPDEPGLTYDNLPSRHPTSGFSEQAQINAQPEIQKLNEAAKEAAKNLPFGKQRESREQGKAELEARRQDAETAWKDGTLIKPLPEIWREISQDAAGRRRQSELDFGTGPAHGSPIDKALSDYYDQLVYHGGTVDWDATTARQEDYLASLPTDVRSAVEDYLGVQERAKDPLWQEYHAYIEQKKALGYFEDNVAQGDKAKLDAAHPEIDVQTWRFYSGVQDQTNTPTLNSAAAVDQALKLADSEGLKNRPIRYAGLARAVNENAQTIEAWNYSKKAINAYENIETVLPQAFDQEARRLYGKPFAQLPDNQKQSVKTNIDKLAREQSPELDAWLAWWGATDTLRTQAAIAKLKDILAKYGKTPPKADYTLRLASQ